MSCDRNKEAPHCARRCRCRPRVWCGDVYYRQISPVKLWARFGGLRKYSCTGLAPESGVMDPGPFGSYPWSVHVRSVPVPSLGGKGFGQRRRSPPSLDWRPRLADTSEALPSEGRDRPGTNVNGPGIGSKRTRDRIPRTGGDGQSYFPVSGLASGTAATGGMCFWRRATISLLSPP